MPARGRTLRGTAVSGSGGERSLARAAAVCAGAPALLAVGTALVLRDEARGAPALAGLGPLIDPLRVVGGWWASRALPLTLAVMLAAAAALLALAWRRRRTPRPAAALGATAFALAGEGALLAGGAVAGSLLLLAGVALVVAVGRSAEHSCGDAPRWFGDPGATRNEAVLLVAVLAIATALRLYALDRVVGWFDGELTGYYAAATRLAGIPLANEGVDGSWAPLGLTFYPPYVVALRLAGTTVLALRLAAAWVGVLTIPLFYLFVRRVAGAPAALLAAALLALDPLNLGWSRSDVHPHGFTLWPVLLVCLATLAALRAGTRRAWLATALTMGLAWHQYPSGQAAVLIPPLALALQAGGPDSRRARWRRGLPFLLLGVVLWFAGLPLSGWLATGRVALRNPFTLTGARAAWGQDPGSAGLTGRAALVSRTAVANAADLALGIFREARVVSHQDFLPDPGPVPVRTLPWAVAVAGLLGTALLVRRRADPGAAVLLAWLAAAPLPALLAAEAYPKRAATLFPALIAIAAVFAVWLVDATWREPARRPRRALAALAGAALLVHLALTCFAWFSGRSWPARRPTEIAVARHVAAEIVPGTLVVVDGVFSYLDGKLLFLLLDDLVAPLRRPNAYLIFEGDTEAFRRIVERPVEALAYLDETAWPYRWTRLAEQRAELDATGEWRRAVWVIGARSLPDQRPNPRHVALVRAACPGARERTFADVGAPAPPYDVTVLVCESPAAGRRAGTAGSAR